MHDEFYSLTEKLKNILQSLYGFGPLGDVVTKLQTFIWIFNYVSRVIT